MISLLRHTTTKQFLALLLLLAFLCVSLWQSSHVHHQHGPADAELVFLHKSFVPGLSDSHHGDTKHHGQHSHDAPDKTVDLHKHQPGWKSLRGKADGGSKLKIPVVICTRVIAIPPLETSSIPSSYAIAESGIRIDGRPPARAPPVTFRLS